MNNKEDTSEGILYKPLCNDEIAKITSSEIAVTRKFSTHDLISRHKNNIFIRAYVDYYGGYAEHGRQVVLGLAETGNYNIRLLPLRTPVDIDPVTYQKLNHYVYNANVYNENAVMLTIAGVGYLQKKFLAEDKINVGWTMTETLEYPEFCHEWLNNVDYLLCPTDTDVTRASKAGVESSKLHKVQLGYDDRLYHDKVPPIDLCGLEGRYVFGVVGSWNIRKSVNEIVKAYLNTFTSKDNVSLLLMCKYGTRPYGVEKENKERWTIQYEFNEILKNYDRKDLPHVTIIDIPVHENILPNIFAKMNCLIGFSKGESTWLPGIQAMAMGIPVIQLASECSGFMEYMNDDNSYLCKEVVYSMAHEELVLGTSEYYENGIFAFGSVDELSEKMKEVRRETDSKKQQVKIYKAKIEAQKWTWDSSIKSLCRFFNKIY